MSRVNDQMNVVPALLKSQSSLGEGASPVASAGLTRKQVVRRECLKFPRAASDSPAGQVGCLSDGPPTTASTQPPPPRDGEASPPLMDTGSSAASAADQLEDLRLQNAVLRKSLAMLQQSVVDSMKGNKAQFMGNGIFRQRKAEDPISGPALGAAVVQDADLEGLRASLAERRQALRLAIAERDEVLGNLADVRRESAELQERNRTLEARLAERAASVEAAAGLGASAEEARRAAVERVAALEAAAEEASRELAALREALAETQARACGIERELAAVRCEGDSALQRCEALLSERDVASAERDALRRCSAGLEDELGAWRGASDAAQEKAGRLELRCRAAFCRRVAAALGCHATARDCFAAWSALCIASREESWEIRAEELRRDRASVGAELEVAQAAASAAEGRAAAAAAEAAASRGAAREAEEALAAAKAEAARCRAEADEACERIFALQNGASDHGALAAERDAAAARLQEADQRLEELRRELGEARDAAQLLTKDLEARGKEAAAREASLKKEIGVAGKAAEEARKASAAAQRSLEEAKRRAAELESQHEALASQLEAVRGELSRSGAEAADARRASEEARSRAAALQTRVDELLGEAASLESREKLRAAELERLGQENGGLQRDVASLRSSLDTAQAAAGRETALTKDLADMRMSLAEARSDAKSAAERVKMLQGEKAAMSRATEDGKAVSAQAAELSRERAQFQEDARKALEEARQSIRIMVTAPKVAINVGHNDFNVQAPFPFEAIKESVRNEVIPRYLKVFAVAESAGDGEIRKEVQAMVEKLASSLQTKIFELMPHAEGTCNWDGFGSKCGALGNAR